MVRKFLLFVSFILILNGLAIAQSCGAYFTNTSNGLTVTFMDSSFVTTGSISTYLWDFGDTNTASISNPIHIYARSGTYAVCLDIISSGGCRDTYCDSIVITPFPCTAKFSYRSDTSNTVTFSNFSNPTSNVSYLWDFGDNTTDTVLNPVHTYASPGVYSVNLTLNSSSGTGLNCSISDSIYANYCDAFFTYVVGVNGRVTFTGIPSSSDATSFRWDLGDGSSNIFQKNTVHTYSSPGLYNVTFNIYDSLTGLNCSYTDSIRINSTLPCAAGFTTTANQNVLFIQNMAQNANQFHYDFGDGNSSIDPNPIHTYFRSGSYTITQIVSDSMTQCSDTMRTQVLIVVPSPCQANFSYAVFQRTVTIQNLANSFNNMLYDFGDGNTTNKVNPTHTYLQDGNYLICQTVNDTNGCADIFCDTVNIITTQCLASYTYTTSLDTVRFSGNAAFFTEINYDFGDGNYSSEENPVHIYNHSGTYQVCQTVRDTTNSCQDVYCDSIQVFVPAPCTAGFSHTVNDKTASFISAAANYTSLSYDFGDGNSSGQANPTHTYSQAGSYEVCQTVVDGNRCSTFYCDSVFILDPQPLCVAGFDYTIMGDSVSFENKASNFTSLLYHFGDGDSSTIENPYHAYQESGTYVVRQLAYNDNTGCLDEFQDTITVTVSRSCVAMYVSALDTNQRGTLFLINTSTDDESHTYYWDFGDGSTGSGRTPTHQFSENRKFNICLTVNDDLQGCTSTHCALIGLDSLGRVLKSGGFLLRVIDGQFIGIEEKKVLDQLEVYPNPTNDRLFLDLEDASLQLNYAFYSISGQLLMEGRLNNQSNQIDLVEFPNGVYLLRLINGEESLVKRIIKQ